MNQQQTTTNFLFRNKSLSEQLTLARKEKSIRYHFIAKNFSKIFAIFTIAVGVLALLGWASGNVFLVSILPNFPTMKTNSAIGVILIGISLLLSYYTQNKIIKILFYGSVLLFFLLGLFTFCEYLLHVDLHIDQIIAEKSIHAEREDFPYRMAPNSALIFALIGVSMLTLRFKKIGKTYGIAAILLATILLLPTIIGYLYGYDFIYGTATNTKLALPTTIAFTTSIVSILLLYVEHGYFPTALSDSTGGYLSRRIVLITVILPLIIGWTILIGFKGGLYDQEFRFLLQIAAWIVIFTYVFWRNAVSLDKIDQERKQIQQNEEFLSEASNILSSTIEYKKTLPKIASLANVYMADWCCIGLKNKHSILELIAITHRQKKRSLIVQEYMKKHKMHTFLRIPAKENRQAVIFPSITDNFYENYAHEPIRRKLLTSLKVTSGMIIPIVIRGEIIGRISFFMTNGRRRYCTQDLAVASDLGRRISLAVYNAQLYSDARNAISLRDEFISVASHELKNPLTSLKVYIQLLEKKKQEKGKSTNEYLSHMDEQVEKLNRMISDLLNVSRIRSGKMTFTKETFDLGKLTTEIVATLKESVKTHTFSLSTLEPQLVVGDKDRIGQVITNLLTNATRYSPPGSTITVSMEKERETVQVSVKDEGIGIEKTQQKKIFNRFYQVRSQKRTSQGLGIGLYISKEIIEKHHGHIWVESNKGKGSIFSFSLPIH